MKREELLKLASLKELNFTLLFFVLPCILIKNYLLRIQFFICILNNYSKLTGFFYS